VARYDQRKDRQIAGRCGYREKSIEGRGGYPECQGVSSGPERIPKFRYLHLEIRGRKAEEEQLGKSAGLPARICGIRRDEQRPAACRGFKFVGTTICYAFMQAVGMVKRSRARLLSAWRNYFFIAPLVELPDLLVSQKQSADLRVRRVWPEDSTPATRPIQAWPHRR